MAYRFRGRGQFTAPSSRSGKAYTYAGRRVLLRENNFSLEWNGPQIITEVLNAVTYAISNLSDEALSYMQSIVPVDTGELRDSCFAQVFTSNGKISLVIGASARHAVYIELGTSSHSAQPFIRPTFDFVVQKLPGIIKAEVASRGR